MVHVFEELALDALLGRHGSYCELGLGKKPGSWPMIASCSCAVANLHAHVLHDGT